jgi:cell wall-associated NlpC family hydrolase
MGALCLIASIALVTAGCATGSVAAGRDSAPAALPQVQQGPRIASLALELVGTPYRFGGASPEQGFDCSGLVYYSHLHLGLKVPRTAQDQFKAARKISLRQAEAGDVMFFQDEAKLAHVGIYVGDGRFVHAPSSGRRVSVASLDSIHYQEQLVAVGRLLMH